MRFVGFGLYSLDLDGVGRNLNEVFEFDLNRQVQLTSADTSRKVIKKKFPVVIRFELQKCVSGIFCIGLGKFTCALESNQVVFFLRDLLEHFPNDATL